MNTKNSTERYYFLDWLRVFGILTVFFFHCAHFFVGERWHVNDTVIGPGAVIFSDFAITWMMPLIFVVSGASIVFALRPGGTGKFVMDKVKRLLIPLIFGIIFLSPPQIYLERLTHGEFSGSFLDFIPHAFEGLYFGAGTGNFAWMGVHLWYLEALFIFTLILLPLFAGLKSQFGQRITNVLGSILSFPGIIFLLAIPIGLVMGALDPSTFGRRDMGGVPVFAYPFYLLYGFLIFTDRRTQQMIMRQRFISLVVVIVTIVLLETTSDQTYFGTIGFTLRKTLDAFLAWGFILTFVGFAMRHGNVNHWVLSYANEAVLPFYILHQPIILILGYFVIPLSLPVAIKYALITLTAFALVMVIYEFAVRRLNILRLCFGMKLVKKTAAVTSISTQAVTERS